MEQRAPAGARTGSPSRSSGPSRLQLALERIWQTRGPAAWLLLPLSKLFGALVRLRRLLYRAGWLKSERLPVPVVVVGNIFVGGTGKTPLTIWLVQRLREAGRSPAVVSRGYGANTATPRLVTAASTPAEVGDEPVLIAERAQCPMAVGRDRAAAAHLLLQSHPEIDVLLLDDGLQHYALARDVEIMLFDGRGAGNGWMLPAGPLREPVSRRRDVTVINGASTAPGVPAGSVRMDLRGDIAVRLCDPAQRLRLADLAAAPPRRLLAAAGIGNPERFFRMLEGFGLRFERLPLPDHHDFADDPFAACDADVILITEKDAVKCRLAETARQDERLWYVPVEAAIDAALAKYLVEKLRGFPTD
ncbi:tetraacyldisaccharide 4'-kinase [Noviherbaspirillum pedocola]|uniref:tetraacyldisaccharide 4'-kinase n=1 Tax=Noviherbaspirillum pedocola TaxID=2801341 RepID=UPI003898FA5E